MKTPDLSTVHWRKSKYSGAEGGQCVQVATLAARPVAPAFDRPTDSGAAPEPPHMA